MEKTARLEQTILKNLVHNKTFSRKVLPYIKSEYFTEVDERTVFEQVQNYFLKFSSPPTTEALLIDLDANDELSDNSLLLESESESTGPCSYVGLSEAFALILLRGLMPLFS